MGTTYAQLLQATGQADILSTTHVDEPICFHITKYAAVSVRLEENIYVCQDIYDLEETKKK